jgi:hypothetical protein
MSGEDPGWGDSERRFVEERLRTGDPFPRPEHLASAPVERADLGAIPFATCLVRGTLSRSPNPRKPKSSQVETQSGTTTGVLSNLQKSSDHFANLSAEAPIGSPLQTSILREEFPGFHRVQDSEDEPEGCDHQPCPINPSRFDPPPSTEQKQRPADRDHQSDFASLDSRDDSFRPDKTKMVTVLLQIPTIGHKPLKNEQARTHRLKSQDH